MSAEVLLSLFLFTSKHNRLILVATVLALGTSRSKIGGIAYTKFIANVQGFCIENLKPVFFFRCFWNPRTARWSVRVHQFPLILSIRVKADFHGTFASFVYVYRLLFLDVFYHS